MRKTLAFLYLILNSTLFAQTSVPYTNNFDFPQDTIGWSHYVISGTDSWEWGIPAGAQLNESFTPSSAWATNLVGNWAAGSSMALESPSFDLSDTSKNYMLGFSHQTEMTGYHGGNVEYSLNSGLTWNILNDSNSTKYNWFNNASCSGLNNEPTWSYDYYSSNFRHSYHALSFLKGNTNVKFRFKFGGSTNPAEGWVIDHFVITQTDNNLYAVQVKPDVAKLTDTTFTNNLMVMYTGTNTSTFTNNIKLYWSTDTVLDSLDTFLGFSNKQTYGSGTASKTFNIPANISPGTYYIFYELDFYNNLNEYNESDNTGYVKLIIENVHPLPYYESFDTLHEPWIPYLGSSGKKLLWELGPGYRHHLEYAHSGNNAWHTSKSIDFDPWGCTHNCNEQYVESPWIDLTTSLNNPSVSFWYKKDKNSVAWLQYKAEDSPYWNYVEIGMFNFIPLNRDDEWDFYTRNITHLKTHKRVKFRIKFQGSYLAPEGFIFDDFYVGDFKPDLTIERDLQNRFTSSSVTSDTLKYYLSNAGLSTATFSYTNFYWSNDTILDNADVLLGTKLESAINDTSAMWTKFAYTKPTISSGVTYIIYVLDTANSVNEMNELNNTGYFTLYQNPDYTLPYYNDFESQINDWRHNSSLGYDDWAWTDPKGFQISQAFSGTKGFVTSDTGLIHDMSRMHLYTPIFDLSTTNNPVISFDMQLDGHGSCLCPSGKTNMSYSIDQGATWHVLDTTSQSFSRWYYQTKYASGRDYHFSYNSSSLMDQAEERTFVDKDQYYGRDADRNTRYILDITPLAGQEHVQFRFNVASVRDYDLLDSTRSEGALIDNFEIKEKYIDLRARNKRNLISGKSPNELRFFMKVKNQGNYISNAGVVEFYLCSDSVINSGAILLGNEALPSIQPDMNGYINVAFPTNVNWNLYSYLIYKIDANNTSIESDEANNIGYWPIIKEGIITYPYFNDFSDSVVEGWNYFSLEYLTLNRQYYRFRNYLAPAEPNYNKDLRNGQFFTDVMNPSYSKAPEMFLESPSFNFEHQDSILLTFTLMCTGATTGQKADGGNLQYSLDGGGSWQLLNPTSGLRHNWYNRTSLPGLNNQPGWSYTPAGYGVGKYDSVAVDIGFLRGNESVIFRYYYKSNHTQYGAGTPQGMRLDDFHIYGESLNYIAQNDYDSLKLSAGQLSFYTPYSISNQGPLSGRVSKLRYYLSTDASLDSLDLPLDSLNIAALASGQSITDSVLIQFPIPIQQKRYWIFYIADADSSLAESNEDDNLGSFVLDFPSSPNYSMVDLLDTILVPIGQSNFSLNYNFFNSGFASGTSSSTAIYWSIDTILDASDQLIHNESELALNVGDSVNKSIQIALPSGLNKNFYYVFLHLDDLDSIQEISELDNWGMRVVHIDYNSSLREMGLESINVYQQENKIVIDANFLNNVALKDFEINLTDMQGKSLWKERVLIKNGRNELKILDKFSDAVYTLIIHSDNHSYTEKMILIEH